MQGGKYKAGVDDQWVDEDRFENESEDSFCYEVPDLEAPELTDAAAGSEQPTQSTRRRLRVKTAGGAEHGYTKRPLLHLQEHRIQMHTKKVAELKQKAEYKTARRKAIELLAYQPPPGAFDENDGRETEPLQQPHESHRVVALHGNSTTI